MRGSVITQLNNFPTTFFLVDSAEKPLLNVDNVQLILNEALLLVNLLPFDIQFPVFLHPSVNKNNVLRTIYNTWKHLDLNNIS